MIKPVSSAVPDYPPMFAESEAVPQAREAGGLTYDWDGSEHVVDPRFTVASAPSPKRSLLELLPGL